MRTYPDYYSGQLALSVLQSGALDFAEEPDETELLANVPAPASNPRHGFIGGWYTQTASVSQSNTVAAALSVGAVWGPVWVPAKLVDSTENTSIRSIVACVTTYLNS